MVPFSSIIDIVYGFWFCSTGWQIMYLD